MPPANFVTGHLAQLEDAFASAVEEARGSDQLAPVTVLTGQVLLKRYLPRMLALRGVAHMNVRFLSPHELSAELNTTDAGQRTRMTPDAERLLVRQVAAAAEGPYFGAIARGEGFVDALRRLLRDLELGGFASAAEFTAAIATGSDWNAPKVRELAAMYGDYLARRDAAGVAGLAEAYATADPSRLIGPLLVYGLWSPAEVQLRLLERIAAVRDVTVFLPARAGDGDDVAATLRLRFQGAAERALPTEDRHALDEVALRLFHPGDGAAIQTGDIELVSAPDTLREVWEAARTCLHWAAEGIDFHQMAIVYRNSDPYRPLVDEIFREAGIDTYVHDGRPVAEHPRGRRLLALLDLAADDQFSRRQVMEFLTETRLSHAVHHNEKYGRVNPSRWETFTREAGVVAGIDQWRTRLARLSAERRAMADREGLEWRADAADGIDQLRTFIDDFHAALQARATEGSWEEHLSYLRSLATAYAEGTKEVLDDLDDLCGLTAITPRVTFDVFFRAVRDHLDRRDVSGVFGEPLRSFGKKGVAVLDASSLRHLRFRAVYLLGAAERAWPPPMRPDPLLLEHERAMLNAAGPGVVPLRTSPDEDAPTFALAVQAARDRLAVSFARADAGGTGKHVPSYYFRAVAEALTGRSMTVADVEASRIVRRIGAGRLACDDIADAVTVAEYDRGLLRGALDGIQPAPTAALAAGSPSFGRAIVARRNRWGAAQSAYDGVMSSPDAMARAAALQFGREKAVSASRLETYAHCPYKFFLQYALRISPLDEPEALDRITAMERGSMIHAVLEAFLARVERGDPPSAAARERHTELLLQIAREEGAAREAKGVTGRPLLWRMEKRRIHHDLIRWYEEEIKMAEASSLRPGAFEVGFGATHYGAGNGSAFSTKDPITLTIGGGDMRVQGRVDRIDWDDARTRFRVIDYKTGGKYGGAAFEGGTALQLPIYLRAASRLLNIDERAGEASYFYVSTKGKFARTTVSGDELAQRDAEFEQVLSTIAAGVDGGYFAPNPGPAKKNCSFCDFKDICDRDIDRVMAHKQPDARAEAYFLMRDIP